jgi:hypothetical protein
MSICAFGGGTPRRLCGQLVISRHNFATARGASKTARTESIGKIKQILVDREGIEPLTRGFSVSFRGIMGLINQSLAALANPLPRLTKAQSWHTKSELVTILAPS